VRDWVEDTLAGLDDPRSLPPALRHRVERWLVIDAPGAPSLDEEVTARLADTLSDPLAPWTEQLGAPRPLPAETRQRLEHVLVGRRRGRRLLGTAVAAGVLLLAGIVAAVDSAGSGPSGPSKSATRASAEPGAARAPRTTVTGPQAQVPRRAGTPVPSSVPAAGPAPSEATEPGVSAGGAESAAAGPASAAPAAGPSVATVDPAGGPAAGGTWVTITGSALSGATSVLFGSTPASFVVVSGSSLRAESPAHAPGVVEVQVASAQGSSPTTPGAVYRYG
jgi:IPT/TIG domain-containing protein